MAPFGMLLGVILGPISDQILILFLNPQNRGFAIPSHTFRYSSITKALILGPLFDHFFDPILGHPFEEPFGPPWPPKVPTLPPHVDFGVILGPPLDPKWDLGAPTGGQRGKKGWSFELGSRSRLRLGRVLCANGVPKAILIDFGTPLGDQGSLLGPPWVTKVLIRDPLGCHKARFETPWVTQSSIFEGFGAPSTPTYILSLNLQRVQTV